MLARIFPYRRRFHLMSRLLFLYQRSGMQAVVRRMGLAGLFGEGMARAEALMPALSAEPGVALNRTYPAEGERAGTVALFTGCVMNSVLGSVNRATLRLLNAAGYDVVVPGNQICCGALANHAGLRDIAVESAKKNIAAFSRADVEAILINAAGCGSMLKEYGLLLEEGKAFSAKVRDISEFLASTRLKDRLQTPLAKRVGYDDPCHLLHGQRVRNEPRQLLRAIPGIEFVEVEGADQCCGSAGIYNLVQNELSMAILDAKMEKIRNARIEILATGNPGCMFQLRYGAERAGLTLEVVHPMELLERALG
jgi:glycolate oxidase iron-sulfur subunit